MDKLIKAVKNHYRQPEPILSTQCSCEDCDSLCCFAKRHADPSCSCKECINQNSCLFYTNKKEMKESQSQKLTTFYLNETQSATPGTNPEQLNQNNNFEVGTNLIQSNQLPQNSLDKGPIDKQKPASEASSNNKQDSLKETISTEASKNIKPLQNKIPRCKGLCKKCLHVEGRRCRDTKKNVTQVHNVMLPSYIPTTAAAKLSAQIMNVHYSNIRDSISCVTSDLSTYDESSNDKYDILKRLKDAYNACSCKICECIPSKLLNTDDVCNCKPCECAECTRYMTFRKTRRVVAPYLESGYATIRPKIRAPKMQKDCSCKPCECSQCQFTNLASPCNCEPCQCIECRPNISHKNRTLIVAPVTQHNQHIGCQYSASDRIESVRGHDISTDTKKYTACHCELCLSNTCAHEHDICQCGKRNILCKPRTYSHDFDIRTASLIMDIYNNGNVRKESKVQNNLVSMFAAIPNVYRRYGSDNLRIKSCSCKQCECLSCTSKEHTINAIKSSRLYLHDNQPIIDQSTSGIKEESERDICDCKPCECEVCTQSKIKNEYRSLKRTSCTCDECLCVGECSIVRQYCGHGYPISSGNRHERCLDDYLPIHSDYSGPTPIHSRNLTSSAHLDKLPNQNIEAGNLPTTSGHKPQWEITNQNKTPIKIYSIGATSTPAIIKLNNASRPMNRTDVSTDIINSFDDNDILKCDAYMQCRQSNKDSSLHENKLPVDKSRSYISYYSSIATSITSICTEQDNVMGIFRTYKSHKHSDHEKLLPKSTVETCLEDVFNTNLRNDLKLNAFDVKRNSDIYNVQKPIQIMDDTLKDAVQSIPTYVDHVSKHEKNEHNVRPYSYEHVPKTTEFLKSNYKNCNSNYINKCSIIDEENAINNYKKWLNANAIQRNKYNEQENGVKSKSLDNKYKTKLIINDQSIESCPLVKNLSQDHHFTRNAVPDNNVTNDKLAMCIKSEDLSTGSKQTSHSNVIENLNSLNINENLKTVNKTLKDAKEFTLELLNLLDTFERANKEFEKVSDKIKTHQALSAKPKIREVETDNNIKVADDISKTLHIKDTIAPYPVTNTENSLLKEVNEIAEIANDNVAQKLVEDHPGNYILNLKPSNTLRIDDTFNELETIPSTHKPQTDSIKIYRNDATNEVNKEKCNDEVGLFNHEPNEEIIKTIRNDDKKAKVVRSKNCKKCKKIVKRTVPVSKKTCLVKPDPHYSPVERSAVFATEKEKPTLASTSYIPATNDQSVVKESIKVNPDSDLSQDNVQIIPKPSVHKLNEVNAASLPIDESNVENQKARFLAVRKVSDHTVLIKWTQPRDLTNVQGYELLVDGRAVQKLFNPYKCMAVVMCLPHVDKVLLTIRTIINGSEENYPATTIAYRPRAKSP